MKYIDNYSNDLQSKVARNILFVTLYIIYIAYSTIVLKELESSHILVKNVTDNISHN